MNKNQPMRWNRYTVQPFLTVRVCVLNGTLEEAFRALHRDCRPPKGPPIPALMRTTTVDAPFSFHSIDSKITTPLGG